MYNQLMKVKNMVSPKGRVVPNQFVITNGLGTTIFQSYDTRIAVIEMTETGRKVTLDRNFDGYSKTTSKWLAVFMNMPMRVIKDKASRGIFKVKPLN